MPGRCFFLGRTTCGPDAGLRADNLCALRSGTTWVLPHPVSPLINTTEWVLIAFSMSAALDQIGSSHAIAKTDAKEEDSKAEKGLINNAEQ